jgi:hypothetical protein
MSTTATAPATNLVRAASYGALTVVASVLLAVPATAAGGTGSHSSKAQIEYTERTQQSAAAGTAAHPSKAQVEYAERLAAHPPAKTGPSTTPAPHGDAAVWQLAASALAGAAAMGLGVAGTRRFARQNGQPATA